MKTIKSESRLINQTFKDLGVKSHIARTSDITIAPYSFVTYQLSKAPDTKVSDIQKYMSEIKSTVSRYRGKNTAVIFDSELLTLIVPNPRKEVLQYDSSIYNTHDIDSESMLVGKISYGPYINDLQIATFDNYHHILVAGTSGSGKSVLLKTMLTSLAKTSDIQNMEWVLVDMKNEDLVPFKDFPYVKFFTGYVEDAHVGINMAYEEMQNRIRNNVANPKRLVVVIDELPAITDKDLLKKIDLIAGRGRSKKVNLMVTVQHATEKAGLSSTLKNNLALRIVGKVNSRTASNAATDNTNIQAEKLEGKGSFYFIKSDEYYMVQSFLITDKDIEDVKNQLPARSVNNPTPVVEENPMVSILKAEKKSVKTETEIIAEQIGDLWADDSSIASMIRRVFGETANTGGSNRNKILAAIKWLENNLDKFEASTDSDNKIIKLHRVA